jgi:hypothetical protein
MFCGGAIVPFDVDVVPSPLVVAVVPVPVVGGPLVVVTLVATPVTANCACPTTSSTSPAEHSATTS